MINQLAELAELAPDICQRIESPNGDYYLIGNYRFWFVRDELVAQSNIEMYKGQPALDWLQCALQRMIVMRGWYLEVRYWPPRQKWEAEVANRRVWGDTPTETLLATLLAALREQDD